LGLRLSALNRCRLNISGIQHQIFVRAFVIHWNLIQKKATTKITWSIILVSFDCTNHMVNYTVNVFNSQQKFCKCFWNHI
jgi:hypothetical protein